MLVLWVLALLALLVAFLALTSTRRLARKLEALNQSYWELRYDFTRLRSQVTRLDPGEPPDESNAEPPVPQPSSQVTFVPLSSMKKKNE